MAVVKTKSNRVSAAKAAKTTKPVDNFLIKKQASLSLYSDLLDAAEKKTGLRINRFHMLRPLSTGVLQFDRIQSGGAHAVVSLISGLEGSGKSTKMQHILASGIKNPNIKFSTMFDAEGTMNELNVKEIFKIYGLDYDYLTSGSPPIFRPYKNNVIETIFDFAHKLLTHMPDKVWLPEAHTWAYAFSKGTDEKAKRMKILREAMGIPEDKSLSTATTSYHPTDYDGVEGMMFGDSVAAMVSIDDDEAEEKSKRRAREASAFSDNYKRIVSRMSAKGVGFYLTNQLRENPDARGSRGPSYRDPGGNATKFYSSVRNRTFARNPQTSLAAQQDKEVFDQYVEESVHVAGFKDRYKYQHTRNIKNKQGMPGLQVWTRIWIADHEGNMRGYDPVFDAVRYMLDTGQLINTNRKTIISPISGEKVMYPNFKFKLRKSAGKSAAFYNELGEVPHVALKLLILAEVERSKPMYVKLSKFLKLDPSDIAKHPLRKSLLKQVQEDREIYQMGSISKASDEDDDIDSDDGEEL